MTQSYPIGGQRGRVSCLWVVQGTRARHTRVAEETSKLLMPGAPPPETLIRLLRGGHWARVGF